MDASHLVKHLCLSKFYCYCSFSLMCVIKWSSWLCMCICHWVGWLLSFGKLYVSQQCSWHLFLFLFLSVCLRVGRFAGCVWMSASESQFWHMSVGQSSVFLSVYRLYDCWPVSHMSVGQSVKCLSVCLLVCGLYECPPVSHSSDTHLSVSQLSFCLPVGLQAVWLSTS